MVRKGAAYANIGDCTTYKKIEGAFVRFASHGGVRNKALHLRAYAPHTKSGMPGAVTAEPRFPRRRPQQTCPRRAGGHGAGAKDFACTVGGVQDDAYVIRDKDRPVDELRVGSPVRTTSALDDSTVSIVTESGSVFRFGQ